MSVEFDVEKSPLMHESIQGSLTHSMTASMTKSLGLRPDTNYKMLALCSLATIAGGLGQGIFIVMTIQATSPFFVFASTAPPFMIMFGIVFAFQYKNLSTTERTFKQFDMFVIGFLNFLNGVLVLFPNNFVPGVLQALLGPTVLTTPITMFFSYVFLRRRYDWARIIMAVIILGGVVVGGSANFVGGEGHLPPSEIPIWVWTCLFVASSIPVAFACVYEEKIFSSDEVPSSTGLLFWSTFWQTVSIMTVGAGMDLIPAFGNDTVHTLVASFTDAFKCMGGDTSVSQWAPSSTPPHALECQAYCYCEGGRTAIVWMLFTFAYVLQSFGSLGVVKYGNATLSQIMSAVVTPVQAVAFCIPFIMKPFSVAPFTWQVIVSLITIVLGMVGYTYFDNRIRHKTLVFVV